MITIQLAHLKDELKKYFVNKEFNKLFFLQEK